MKLNYENIQIIFQAREDVPESVAICIRILGIKKLEILNLTINQRSKLNDFFLRKTQEMVKEYENLST